MRTCIFDRNTRPTRPSLCLTQASVSALRANSLLRATGPFLPSLPSSQHTSLCASGTSISSPTTTHQRKNNKHFPLCCPHNACSAALRPGARHTVEEIPEKQPEAHRQSLPAPHSTQRSTRVPPSHPHSRVAPVRHSAHASPQRSTVTRPPPGR